jgi:hypothetical protein
MTELLESIGKIKHLRYLNLSSTAINRLPDSICKLCNLQTLNLSSCKDLSELPRDMWKLINLRHLDIIGTAIKEMPMQLSRLKYLQTLSKFVVSKHSEACMEELGKLTNLRGRLSILELQNVIYPTDALKACLEGKKYMEELVLEWNEWDTNISESQRTVLHNLLPYSNLKSLTITNYGGESLPNWVGNHSFSKIVSLNLTNCKLCSNLPPLGQLPSLLNLSVFGFEGVVKVDREFYCSDSLPVKSFGALKVLRFVHMLSWEEWSSFGAENEVDTFPQLEELYIYSCPKLRGGLPVHLPSLIKLEIEDCPQLVATLPRAPAAHELKLRHCNEVLLKELPNKLRKIVIEGFDTLESLPIGMVASNNCLRRLEISECMNLELPTHLNFSSLERLEFHRCDSLKSFPLDLFPKLSYISIWLCRNMESLTVSEQHGRDLVTLSIAIVNCCNFVSFPKGGIHAPQLSFFSLYDCGSLRSLPEKMHTLLPSLNVFRISCCKSLTLFPEGGFPSNLRTIEVENCENLFAGRMGWGLQKLTSLRELDIGGKSEDVVSFPEPGLLPSCLTSLTISKFPNMKSLDKRGLQHLTSLQQLCVWNCPKLESIPKEGLPTSLSIIKIVRCPLLRKRWQSKKRKERREIPNVNHILIDRKEYIG